MNNDSWKSNADTVAHQLMQQGVEISIGAVTATLANVVAYTTPEENNRYPAILTAHPGYAIVTYRMQPLLLIATWYNGNPGGCVYIHTVMVGDQEYKGPKAVAELFDLPKKAEGTTRWVSAREFRVDI